MSVWAKSGFVKNYRRKTAQIPSHWLSIALHLIRLLSKQDSCCLQLYALLLGEAIPKVKDRSNKGEETLLLSGSTDELNLEIPGTERGKVYCDIQCLSAHTPSEGNYPTHSPWFPGGHTEYRKKVCPCPQLNRPRMGTWTQGSQFPGEIGHELVWKDEPGQSDYLSWEFVRKHGELKAVISSHNLSKGHIISRKAGEATMNRE